jgi:hypothetical protein
MRIAYYRSRFFFIKELTMKRLTVFKHSAFATLLLSTTFAAFAAGGGANGLGNNPNPYASSLTSSPPHSQQTVLADNSVPESVVLETRANAPSNADDSANDGKTRAQVRAELVEAQRAGLIPFPKNDYPPSAKTIARNRALFQLSHAASGQ